MLPLYFTTKVADVHGFIILQMEFSSTVLCSVICSQRNRFHSGLIFEPLGNKYILYCSFLMSRMNDYLGNITVMLSLLSLPFSESSNSNTAQVQCAFLWLLKYLFKIIDIMFI